jgi:L-iditol 2-dehydrogenase
VGPGTHLLVIGLGQVGLLQVQAGVAAGCASVVGVDPLLDRRTRAEQLDVVAVGPEGVGLEPRPTVVLVCTSAPTAVTQALDVVAPGGIVQLFAPAPPGKPFLLDSSTLFFREITIQFSYSAGPHDTREALELLSTGRVRADVLTTHHYPLDRLADAIAVARTPDAVRVVVTGPAARR